VLCFKGFGLRQLAHDRRCLMPEDLKHQMSDSSCETPSTVPGRQPSTVSGDSMTSTRSLSNAATSHEELRLGADA
jgi:hypothetical protein